MSRLQALLHDVAVGRAERAGLAETRARLLGGLRGRVLEIGAGTGLNVPHYGPGAQVVFTEPDRHMARRLGRRGGEVVEAHAELLPFPDASFDVVVATLVFCTVPDVPAALAEVRRVLKPEGRLVFLEHVRGAPGSRLARWQERLHGPWKLCAHGCHCNRDFLSLLAASGFRVDEVEHHAWTFLPPLVRPVVLGSASP